MADKTAGPAGAEASSQRWIDNGDGSFSPLSAAEAKYNVTKPTLTDGQQSELQLNARGELVVGGPVATANTIVGNPVLIGGHDTVNGQIINVPVRIDADGIASVKQLQSMALQMVYNGATIDRARTPSVFKSLSAVVITSETTIWTPAGGKKFRLMGLVISQGVATGAVTFRDNTGGSTVFILGANTVGVAIYIPLGNGILSSAANNVLTAQGASTETITGVVFGTEE